jgi:hypothetical protein
MNIKLRITLLLATHQSVSLSQLQPEVDRLTPGAIFGDWTGSTDDMPSADATRMSINGEPISMMSIPEPAEMKVVEREHYANHIWPTIEADAGRHAAHIEIAATRGATDREAVLAQARAVTLVAAAVARIVPIIGVLWVQGTNSIDGKTFLRVTETIGQPGANAVMLWVRVMLYNEPPKVGKLIGGTLGLHLLGLTDLEYAPSDLEPKFILQHALATSDYLLRSGQTLKDRETIKVEGQPLAFKIDHIPDGIFVPYPVMRLSPVQEKKKWWPW